MEDAICVKLNQSTCRLETLVERMTATGPEPLVGVATITDLAVLAMMLTPTEVEANLVTVAAVMSTAPGIPKVPNIPRGTNPVAEAIMALATPAIRAMAGTPLGMMIMIPVGPKKV